MPDPRPRPRPAVPSSLNRREETHPMPTHTLARLELTAADALHSIDGHTHHLYYGDDRPDPRPAAERELAHEHLAVDGWQATPTGWTSTVRDLAETL